MANRPSNQKRCDTMKIYVSKTLFVYCFKADNYYDYKRRVCLLARYIQSKFDKRLIKCISNMFYGGDYYG